MSDGPYPRQPPPGGYPPQPPPGYGQQPPGGQQPPRSQYPPPGQQPPHGQQPYGQPHPPQGRPPHGPPPPQYGQPPQYGEPQYGQPQPPGGYRPQQGSYPPPSGQYQSRQYGEPDQHTDDAPNPDKRRKLLIGGAIAVGALVVLCGGGAWAISSVLGGGQYQDGECVKQEKEDGESTAVPVGCSDPAAYRIVKRLDGTAVSQCPPTPKIDATFVNFRDEFVLCLKKT